MVDRLAEGRQLGLGAVARFGVDRFALAAVNGPACPRDEGPRLPSHRALAPDLPQGLQGVLAEVRHRLVSRPQLLSQPPQRHIPVRLLFQTTTRPQGIEIAVQLELQQSSRSIGRPARGSGCGALEAERRQVEVVDKGIEEPNGMLCGTIVVEPLREQDGFVAVRAVDKAHKGTKLQDNKEVSRRSEQCYSLPKHWVFTQSGAALGLRNNEDTI